MRHLYGYRPFASSDSHCIDIPNEECRLDLIWLIRKHPLNPDLVLISDFRSGSILTPTDTVNFL